MPASAAAPVVLVLAGMTGASVGVSDRNGAGMVTEIKVSVDDHVAVGGRVEFAVMFGGQVADEDLPFGFSACGLLKGEYLLDAGTLRPFAGLGAGVYSMASHTIVDDDNGTSGISTTTGRYFGVAPSAGVDVGRLRLAATYNAIIGTSVEYRWTTGGVGHRETYSQSYLSLELSFRFGGGESANGSSPAARPR